MEAGSNKNESRSCIILHAKLSLACATHQEPPANIWWRAQRRAKIHQRRTRRCWAATSLPMPQQRSITRTAHPPALCSKNKAQAISKSTQRARQEGLSTGYHAALDEKSRDGQHSFCAHPSVEPVAACRLAVGKGAHLCGRYLPMGPIAHKSHLKARGYAPRKDRPLYP